MSILFFFFQQKTAYEMRISDWSSDVCSSDLQALLPRPAGHRSASDIAHRANRPPEHDRLADPARGDRRALDRVQDVVARALAVADQFADRQRAGIERARARQRHPRGLDGAAERHRAVADHRHLQPEIGKHTSELQSLMRTSYAVFCWKKK